MQLLQMITGDHFFFNSFITLRLFLPVQIPFYLRYLIVLFPCNILFFVKRF